MTRYLSAASALALIPLAAAAQEPFDLGQITVFANQSEIEVRRTGATVDIVESAEIARAAPAKLADVLDTLPGISVSASGGLGGNTNLRIRGLDGKYVSVLIDGIDVADPSSTQTQFDWGLLTTGGISRIEVLKGSQSALYGSEAIGGVINITTARAEEPGTEATVTAEAGSFDTYRLGATVATRGERGGVSFSLNRVETDGFSARAGAANTEADGYDATQLTLAADYKATEILTLGLSAYALNASGDFDEFGGDGAPPFDEKFDSQVRGLRAFADLNVGGWSHLLALSWYDTDRSSTSNGFGTRFEGDRRKLDYLATHDLSDAITYSFGADLTRETFRSGAEAGETDTTGLFAELLYSPTADLDLAFALRHDDHSDFGGNLSGRIAAAWRLGGGTVLRAVASTGFRAPSLYELNSVLYGNRALQPEESVNFELGVEHDYGNGSFVKATAFHTEIDNLIQFITLTSFPLPFTGQYRQAPGTATSKGIEVAGAYALSDSVSLVGSYTYTDATDGAGAPLLRVPGHDLVLGIEADVTPRLAASVYLQHVADRPDDFGTPLRDYTVVNANIGYDITDTATAYLRVENLFDEDYQTVAGFAASDRAVYVGLRASF
jgi:vitamin B12 transporter